MNLRKITVVLAALVALATLSNTAEAKRHYRSGACDGIHRCTCGSTQARLNGFSRMYNGYNLWRAVEWVHAFPRTDAHSGAVGYVRHGGPSGHVFRVDHVISPGVAMVTDERGTYERNISNAIFVDPHGNSVSRTTTTYHAKGKRHYTEVAQVETVDRLMVH